MSKLDHLSADTVKTNSDAMSLAPVPRHRGRLTGSVALLAVAVGVGYGLHAHAERDAAMRTLAAQRAAIIPEIQVAPAMPVSAPWLLDLPGSTEPEESAAISSRASGYIAQRFVDIGSPVKAGQALATIGSPELEQQVSRARAALAQAEATWQLAAATARRSFTLVKDGWVSRQKWDDDRLNASARKADLDAATAALAEMVQRQSYLTVAAPFAGVVTTRNVEAGDLVSADDSQAKPLFVVARADKLRVRVNVPQEAAPSVKPGITASVLVAEYPGQVFSGHVARTAAALVPGTRTLPVEVEVDNADGLLTAGLYVTVRFSLPRSRSVVMVKAESLIYLPAGLHVATVDTAGMVSLRKIQVGRDFGNEVEVITGLPSGSEVALTPPAFLRDGLRVEVRPVSEASTK